MSFLEIHLQENVENDVLRKVSLLHWRDFEKFRTLEKLQE
jgi:hypothetical protein